MYVTAGTPPFGEVSYHANRKIALASPAIGAKHAIGNPIHIYPLYENSFRAHRNQSLKDNHAESAQLYADFARVAAENPRAWNHGAPAETAESIATVTKRNRMICLPCKSARARRESGRVFNLLTVACSAIFRPVTNECVQHGQLRGRVRAHVDGVCAGTRHSEREVDLPAGRRWNIR